MASPGWAELTVGIMSVVTEMGRNVDDEREPTWDEAIASLETATPVEVVRPQREVKVIYRYADGIFTATSPDVRGFRVTGPSMHETRAYVQQDLEKFLDPDVKIKELFPAPDPEIRTSAGGRVRFTSEAVPGSAFGFFVLTKGAIRAFVSSARASMRKEPAS
jgi:hypothetical protein